MPYQKLSLIKESTHIIEKKVRNIKVFAILKLFLKGGSVLNLKCQVLGFFFGNSPEFEEW
jgi:hypothetical protein